MIDLIGTSSLGEEFDHTLFFVDDGLLLGLVASERVLRVDVDVLEGAERRQDLAVVHALEDGNELGLGQVAGDGDVVSLGFVIGLLPLEILNDPKTAIWLILVHLLD